MNTRVRVPIRVKPASVSGQAPSTGAPEVIEATPPVTDREAMTLGEPFVAPTRPKRQDVIQDTQHAIRHTQGLEEDDALEMWRDRAQRLQAEMENFRKRQQRLADERVAAGRERLLRAFLSVADDLERALNANGTDVESLRQGVDITYQTLMQLLGREGLEPVQAKGHSFDPVWHEAVSTVPHEQAGAEPDTVVQVVQAGYRIGDHVLRPSRVIVAT